MTTVTTPTHKVCTRCKIEQPLAAFYRHRRSKDGHRTRCRECESAQQVERRARLSNRADHEIDYPAEKRCLYCGETKPASDFHKDRRNLDGLNDRCKLCKRWGQIQHKYGLTRSEWEAMWEAQGGRCLVCQEPMKRDGTANAPLRAVVDHHPERSGAGCHRALLHSSCNKALPEDPETLRRMAVYVEKGVEALLPDTPRNDTMNDLFGHLSVRQASKRWWGIRDNYHIEPEEWLHLWNQQAGLCPCCQEPMEAVSEKHNRKTSHVDHCHAGGQVRALLHSWCNRKLGLFKDDPKVLRRAARYLELGAEKPVDIARLNADNPLS